MYHPRGTRTERDRTILAKTYRSGVLIDFWPIDRGWFAVGNPSLVLHSVELKAVGQVERGRTPHREELEYVDVRVFVRPATPHEIAREARRVAALELVGTFCEKNPKTAQAIGLVALLEELGLR